MYISYSMSTVSLNNVVNIFREEIMRFFSLVLLTFFLAILILVQPVLAQPVLVQPAHEYVGSSNCGLCHSGEANGYIMENWKVGPHARAFQSLGTEKAKTILLEKYGLMGNPKDEVMCRGCHITGFNSTSTNSTSTSTSNPTNLLADEGVSCEGCHGQGKDYSTAEIMKNRDKAIKLGLNSDPKIMCNKCHNESGHSKTTFDFVSAWQSIKHSRNNLDSGLPGVPKNTNTEPPLPVQPIPSSSSSSSTTETMQNPVIELPTASPTTTEPSESGKPVVKKKKKQR